MLRGSVAFGVSHTLLLDDRARLWAHGYNIDGKCGTGSRRNVEEPVQVHLPWRGCVTSIAMMWDYSVVVRGERLLASGGVDAASTMLHALGASTSFSVVETPGRAVQWACSSPNAIVIGVDAAEVADEVYAHGNIRGVCENSREWVRLDALCGRAIDYIVAGYSVIIFRDAARAWWGYAHNTLVRLDSFDAAHIEYVHIATCGIVAVCENRFLYMSELPKFWGGCTADSFVLTRMHIDGSLRVLDLSVRLCSVIVLTEDGRLWSLWNKVAVPFSRIFFYGVEYGAVRATSVAHMNGDLLITSDTGNAFVVKRNARLGGGRTVLGDCVCAPYFDGHLHSSLPPRTPHTLGEMAAHRVRLADIEAADVRGRAGDGDLVPPHLLTQVRRIARARAVRSGGYD